MKPSRLQLSNYRGFEKADIDLTGIETAAITGPNGAGKSTIVEAILWVLYGKSRSSTIDQIVRLGAREAVVQFDYTHNGLSYRVIRKRSAGKRSELQYLVNDGADWKPLTSTAIPETQEKIIHDLWMDSKLFQNTSFVVQKKWPGMEIEPGGICEATPAERKNLLFAVLEDRLSKYPPLYEAAKATVKRLDERMAVGRAKRAELEVVIAGKESLLETKGNTDFALSEHRRRLEKNEAAANELREKAAAAKADRDRGAEVARQRQVCLAAIENLRSREKGHISLIEKQEEFVERGDEIRAKCAEADKLEADLKEDNAKRDQIQAFQNKRAQTAHELDAEGTRLGNEESQIEKQIENAIGAIEERDRQYALVGEVPCHGTRMTEECELLKYARQAGEDADFWREKLETLKEEAKKASDAIRFHVLRYKDLEAIDHEIESIGYDPDAFAELRTSYEAAAANRPILANLASAEAIIEANRRAIEQLHLDVEARQSELKTLESEQDSLRISLDGQPDHAARLSEEEGAIRASREAIEDLQRNLAVLEKDLRDISEAEGALDALALASSGQEKDRIIYATLQEAFSRDGIPALIIDAVIPQIEELANETLAHLSDGRMTVKFMTQREKVTGGIAETLDIIISDRQGERPYEDYSGGEAIRIALSVRIALGRLLAQRSGAKIELLILDEVCAPLDQAGEDALVDCIDRLRAIFGCVLLITHRESLRDRLPQQINVSANGGGSTIEVIGGCR